MGLSRGPETGGRKGEHGVDLGRGVRLQEPSSVQEVTDRPGEVKSCCARGAARLSRGPASPPGDERVGERMDLWLPANRDSFCPSCPRRFGGRIWFRRCVSGTSFGLAG